MKSNPNKLSSKRIVVSYFEAFDQALNSSELLVESLLKIPQVDSSLVLSTIKLPVVFGRASQELSDFLAEQNWDALLMLGQAGKRAKISLELRAKNVTDPRFADNAGQTPRGRIEESGSAELFSTWNFKEILREFNDPLWELSENAGEYVCNELFYRQLFLQRKKPVGFIHIPLLSPQPGASLELDSAVKSFKAFLRLCEGHLS